MAVEPLYCSSMDSLKSKLRLSDTSDPDTLAVLDEIVLEVRLGFFAKLTRERAQAIALIPLVDNPVTTDDILRARGASTEAVWCLYILAKRLPYSVIDANNKLLDRWNDEQQFRVGELSDRYLNSLKKQIDSGIALMKDVVSTQPFEHKSSLITNPENPGILCDGWGGLSHGHPRIVPPVTKEGVDLDARKAINDLTDAIEGIVDIPDIYQNQDVKNKINELLESLQSAVE